jgi:hypothetical protein
MSILPPLLKTEAGKPANQVSEATIDTILAIKKKTCWR